MSVKAWAKTAKIVADDSLGIQKGERVLLLSGEGADKAEGICDLYAALKEELFSRDLDLTMMSYRVGSNASFGGSVLIPAWHTDSLLPGAKVELDGTVIAEKGQYLV